MFKYLLLIWLLIYIYTLAHLIFELKEIGSVINILEKYLSSAKWGSLGQLIPIDLEKHLACRNELLRNYPKMTKHLGFYTPDLSYGNSDAANYENAAKIYNQLFMHRNYVLEDFKKAFNPIVSFKKLLSIPSTFIEWIGFKPKDTFLKVINLFGWLLAYFLNLYSDELKTLITAFFQK